MQDNITTEDMELNECDAISYIHYRPYTSKELVPVGFASEPGEPTIQEIHDMIDTAISQVLGPQGLAAIIKPGDKVVIKVNLVGNGVGSRGEKNRGGITDPRIVRYVASKVRSIIGFEGTSDLKVVDATFYKDKNPSLKEASTSFYWARLEKNGDNAVDDGDICYDADADGILDGGSEAKLVNLDSLGEEERFTTIVKTASSKEYIVSMPKFIRTREEAEAEGSDEYCDVLIAIPILKSHAMTGVTGGIKLHYGFRHSEGIDGDTGRWLHNGLYIDDKGIHNRFNLFDYLCAQHLVRKNDFVIMDCLTGNRSGPSNPYGQTASSPQKNRPLDYILTDAVLASKDSVAIDTVEAVMAGYDPESIKLLNTGRDNGVGTNDPRYIMVGGLNDFYDHRQYLYKNYSRDEYPFEDGWGGARILPGNSIFFNAYLENPVEIEDGVFAFKYEIYDKYDDIVPGVSRVELWVNNNLVDYKNENDILQGTFILDIKDKNIPKNSSTSSFLAVWDKTFNCLISNEVIFRS